MKNYKELIKNFTEDDYKNNRVNLHIHTSYSDGIGKFSDIVKQAKNYKAIAISDHNTVQGYLENEIPSNIIPAVEFDVWCGYVFIPENKQKNGYCFNRRYYCGDFAYII